ncbi:efflux transporter outer membrane subunit [Paucibacter sp. R3-3]|uniref:Efflux transporter outer membrane subunit n=1 Tax=Roseateles agri TaxID=3098619 RepID=A0ABU5DDK5_9BURK|nr:efflux transporter outer membrane subunit [Paucibacter sp. R3-3]MDY0744364.1 efflux transporter outer membrane subunit [Paucibacter sp. R3-3]
MRPHSPSLPSAVLLLTLVLSACAVGPDYVRPAPPPGATLALKEDGPWRQAGGGAAIEAGAWWTAFGDPVLNGLVDEANKANQTLAAAQAQYAQAQALVQGAQAAWYPTVGVDASVTRGRAISNGKSSLGNSHAWALQAAWEPDLWGRVSRQVEAAGASAQASAADLAAARLVVQAAVVNNYVQLRLADQQKALYARTLEGYRKSLSITQAQFRAGTNTRSDVALAQATLSGAEAQAIDVDLTRRQLEHALAVLLGKTPANFALAPAEPSLAIPAVPELVPSALLERRPDVAGAEARVAAANANIGVAQSAWYPNISLGASGGYQGAGFGDWFSAPGRVWALGTTLAATLFDGGARKAQNAQAQAAFDAAAATYRQTVLAGFQEVEDNLAALNDLAQERVAQDAAVAASREAERVALSQYRAGTTTYLSVITAQTLSLTNERTALQLVGRQYAASVALIKATGGGWQAEPLATRGADAHTASNK